MSRRDAFAVQHVPIHGHDVSYRLAGDGPVIVLVHGLAGSSTTWKHVMPALAGSYTVLAPDLLGHGQSAKPRGDYSLGAYASGIRDLMIALDLERATFVGHSLGGGVAMQLAYQFPERCDRLVLVASGGLGKEVHPLLRAVTLPAAEYVLPLLLTSWFRLRAESAGNVLRRVGWKPGSSLAEVWRSYTTLTTAEGQQAFVHTVRAVMDLSGQRVSATDRLYLAAAVPTLVVWGDEDAVIPVHHAHAAHAAMPGSRLEVLGGAGHFLPWKNGEWFTGVLTDFLATTTPARPPQSSHELLAT
ncbi:MAG: Alpha/beta hydrolase [Acidimicrobiales bacterium]|jgi:pimeloyl-ACP methyl ester carboxylesterase|nr:Alpha/beta hydrolase [Acidimicrobiales bacterium]